MARYYTIGISPPNVSSISSDQKWQDGYIDDARAEAEARAGTIGGDWKVWQVDFNVSEAPAS